MAVSTEFYGISYKYRMDNMQLATVVVAVEFALRQCMETEWVSTKSKIQFERNRERMQVAVHSIITALHESRPAFLLPSTRMADFLKGLGFNSREEQRILKRERNNRGTKLQEVTLNPAGLFQKL